MIEDFWSELEGEIHVRDSLQFELKSEFFIHPHLKQNIYKQEVFLFTPSPLQINFETYSKKQFYLDQTNFIRYKTPFMTLADLVDPDYCLSPLNRLQNILYQSSSDDFLTSASDEIKLFGIIFKVSLRKCIYRLIQHLEEIKPEEIEGTSQAIFLLCSEINQVSRKFRELQEHCATLYNEKQMMQHFKYVDEFMSTTIEEFLIILLKHMRSIDQLDFPLDKKISGILLKEKLYRKKNNIDPSSSRGPLYSNESILHRQGLLNRFVLESLMLNHYRFSLEEKQGNILGATAAGIAMFVYMTLLVWKSSGFVVNSFPFVALAVFLYILKDRIKEGFKNLYYKQAYRWFPDYSTEIRSPKGLKIGKLTESFTFIEPQQLPPGFLEIRNHYFNEELQALQRHETIIQYKREMILKPASTGENRRRELTTIFRLNIHRFLEKASDAFQPSLAFDSYTHEISEKMLPKVYHLNLIIRNTFLEDDLTHRTEIKTFRVVIDKRGIKRVEHIKPLA